MPTEETADASCAEEKVWNMGHCEALRKLSGQGWPASAPQAQGSKDGGCQPRHMGRRRLRGRKISWLISLLEEELRFMCIS